MPKTKLVKIGESPEELFGRIVSILEEARGNVVRAVNSNMVLAYWLIGREIVQELQGGEDRAAYGKKIIADLSKRLTERYGEGFSGRNLQLFKQLYSTYRERLEIVRPLGAQFEEGTIPYPAGTKSSDLTIVRPAGAQSGPLTISSPTGREFKSPHGFSPQLTWSHYRALMRVDDIKARDFYEQEAIECGWSKVQLERQIHSFYYERILSHRGIQGLATEGRERLIGERVHPAQVLKSPMVLEFLGLPDSMQLHESQLEQSIIDNLQQFLLELGKGFSFVARQKHIRFGDDDFYVDLVFYNYILKCFLLIDLKMGKLTHADVGQMDGYVRLYEDQFKIPGDNPTIGLLLCSDKSEAIAKYSILNENRQIFASKYLPNLPSEEQLQREIERERQLIESRLEERQ
jgi:predicted nuclease of restriction endonuclease-like (RecB) superfamily